MLPTSYCSKSNRIQFDVVELTVFIHLLKELRACSTLR